jgi:ArsR family transcriptional regulator, lead/cadmium/zinc/bismuth-responsive transcriptional repressor
MPYASFEWLLNRSLPPMPTLNPTCDVRCVHPEEVEQARAILDAQAGGITGMVTVFDALGDPTRLRLLVALLGGRLCTCDLAAVLGVTESAVSHQLRLLKGLALVASEREGRVVYHRLADGHVRALIEVAREHVEEGVEDGTVAADPVSEVAA